MNEILNKALAHQHYIRAKKACDIDDGFLFIQERVKAPEYKPSEKPKLTVGLWNFFRNLIP